MCRVVARGFKRNSFYAEYKEIRNQEKLRCLKRVAQIIRRTWNPCTPQIRKNDKPTYNPTRLRKPVKQVSRTNHDTSQNFNHQDPQAKTERNAQLRKFEIPANRKARTKLCNKLKERSSSRLTRLCYPDTDIISSRA